MHLESEMNSVDLDFVGPYGWGYDKTVPCIYSKANRSIAKKGGVYLWTVLTQDGTQERDEIVLYVGETTRDFGKRFKEHQGEQAIGWYDVHDPDALVKGQVKLLWDGVYGHDVDIDVNFMSRFEELRPTVMRYMKILRFHLAPVTEELTGGTEMTEFLQRLEAGLAHYFYHKTGAVSGAQDGNVQYLERCSLQKRKLSELDWPPRDATTHVVCHTNSRIRGFPSEHILV